MKNNSLLPFASILTLLLPLASPGAVINADLNGIDRIVGQRQDNGDALGYGVDTSSDLVGVTGSGGGLTRTSEVLVFGFTLPTLSVGETIDSAILNFEITAVRDHNNDDPRLDVYLLDTVNPDSSGTSFYYRETDTLDSSNFYVGDYYIDAGATTDQVDFAADVHDVALSLTGSSLTQLQSLYGGGNVPSQSEVFFRFNLDTAIPGGTLGSGAVYDRYRLDTDFAESSLALTTVPEPSALALLGLAGLGLMLRRRR